MPGGLQLLKIKGQVEIDKKKGLITERDAILALGAVKNSVFKILY